MDEYIIKDNKKLRMGYTTGTCATAAAKAAAFMLLNDCYINNISIVTLKGIKIDIEILDIDKKDDYVSCAVKKDSGDDPDVTNGILIYAKVSKNNTKEIFIDGGIGVGRVTKPGLDQSVGFAAINSTPRKTIKEEVQKVIDETHFPNGLDVIISAPMGEEIAKRTFNPKLGIVGGISILGTTGIVVPMSEDAIIDTIKTEMRMHLACKEVDCIFTPGNYGEAFLKDNYNITKDKVIQCSNYIIDAINYANEVNFKSITLVGHIGKMIKLAGGMVNTHSKYGDNRMETFYEISKKYGLSEDGLNKIKEAVTTDEMIKIIDNEKLLNPVMEEVVRKIIDVVNHKMNNKIEFDVIVFSNVYGLLASSKPVKEILNKFGDENDYICWSRMRSC